MMVGHSIWQMNCTTEPIRRNFVRRRVVVNGIDEIWSADLVDMKAFSKWIKGIKYLLNIIDVF